MSTFFSKHKKHDICKVTEKVKNKNVFLGKHKSTKEALASYPNLRKRLDGGKNLKESSLRAKLLRQYRRNGIPESDLRQYKIRFDRTRELNGRNVAHHTIDNMDNTTTVTEFLGESRLL